MNNLKYLIEYSENIFVHLQYYINKRKELIMSKIAGITTTTDHRGMEIYVKINMRKYGNNVLLEDFLDGQAVEARRGDETKPWSEVKAGLDKKHGLK